MAQPAAPETTPASGAVAGTTSASLYIGDLAPETTEHTLFEVFREVGPVLSIRVCRDRVTRRSLGYAYVNFQNVSDAERTIDALNFMKIKGKSCRIMWAQRDPSLRKTGRNNIFIKNLAKDIDNKTLHDTFSQFGTILSCKVKTTSDGSSAGYGFVHFDSEDSARRAIDTVNGKLLNEQLVSVAPFLPRNKRASADPESSYTNVYIKNLNPNVTTELLEQIFGEFGSVLKAEVQTTTIKDADGKEEKKSKGFGFVNFDLHESAVNAVAKLHDTSDPRLAAETKVDGKTELKKLYCARAQKKHERQKQREEAIKKLQLQRSKYVNLYVKNIPDDYTDEQFKNLFGEYGKIISAKIMLDSETGLSKGFGFVCFEHPEEAQKAVEKLKDHMVGTKPLYINLAQKKEQRHHQLSTQFQQRAQSPQMFMNPFMTNMSQMNQYAPGNLMQNAAAFQQMLPMMQQFIANPAAMQQMFMQQSAAQGRRPAAGNVNSYPFSAAAGGAYPAARGGQQPTRRTGAPPANIPSAGRTGPSGPAAAPIPATGGMPANAAIPAAVPKRPAQPGANYPNTQNISFTSTVRNVSRVPPAPSAPAVAASSQSHLAATLASMSEEEAKSQLGEQLFMRIAQYEPDSAPKITGMLLELDNAELLNLLEDPSILSSKIVEAKQVLEQAAVGEA